MASEIACCSDRPCALSANACDRRKMAASAASTRCRNVCGSPSRSAASNSRCQVGYCMFTDVEVSLSVVVAPYGCLTNRQRMQQAACQRRTTSGTSFNCIVLGMLREDRAAWTSVTCELRWPRSTKVVVLGQGLGNQNLAMKNPAIQHLRFSLGFVGVEASWRSAPLGWRNIAITPTTRRGRLRSNSWG